METDSEQQNILESFMKLTANVVGIATFHLKSAEPLKLYLLSIYTSKNAIKAKALIPDLLYIVSLFEEKSDLLPLFLSQLEQKCQVMNSDGESKTSEESKKDLIKKATKAVWENHLDFPNQSERKQGCKRLTKYLHQQNNPTVDNYLNELRRFSNESDEEFMKYVKTICDDLVSKEKSLFKEFETKQKAKYKDQVKKALNIIAEVYAKQPMTNVSDSNQRHIDNFMSVWSYLVCKETDWITGGGKGLPPDHREILRLKEENNSDHLLVAYFNKLVRLSTSSNCLARVEKMKQNNFNHTVPEGAHEGFDWRLLLERAPLHFGALIGSTFKYGLELLTKIVSNPRMQGLIIAADELMSGIISSNPQLICLGVSATYIAGLCFWNVWQCWKNGRSKKRAGKNVVDALITTTAANLVGFGIASLVAPFVAPVGLVVFISAAAGIFTSYNLQPFVDRLTQWIFNLSKEEALEKAYNVLGVDKNATDEEINRAFRHRSRDYHPDKLNQRGASQQEKEQGMQKIYEIQEALGYITVERQKLADDKDKFSYIDRVIEIFKSFYRKKKTGENEEKEIRALMQIEYE